MTEGHEIDPCIVCDEEQAETIPPNFDGIHQKCPRCGEFKVSRTGLSLVGKGLGKEKRAIISGWILGQNRLGEVPLITTANFEKIISLPLPSLIERATYLLQEAERDLKHLGDNFNINEPRFLAATYSSNKDDVIYLLNLLRDQGLAKIVSMPGQCEILPNGYI
jgi:predicted RNA-binding Zn-ribbon protein involved in translation (DUF1610 family)